MKYVEAGGTLVVQYNTNSRIAPLTAPIGPFPFEIGRDRVTDETAAVTLPAAGHPSLTTPNKIGAHDFDGWIQERGLYFADKWDARYQTPLAMNDPGREAARRRLCSGRATARGRSSTPAWPSSASCPPVSRARFACSRT